jgi:hypothetical protein
MSTILKKRTFKALMAYLNPIGPIGANVDMWYDDIEFFPSRWQSEKTSKFTLVEILEKFIRDIIRTNTDKLYNRTDKKDSTYWVDVTINPKNREIVLIPKYYVYKESKENKKFDWRELRNYYIISRFMENRNIEELTIEYNGHEGNFDLNLLYDNKEIYSGTDNRYVSYETRMMISEILENDDWNEDAGGHGVLKLYDEDNKGYLSHTWIEKNVVNGEPIILTEEDFN